MGSYHPGGERRNGGDTSDPRPAATSLTTGQLEAIFRDHWWAAVAVVTRMVGDLEIAEDAVQEACAAALVQWPAEGIPTSPRSWLVGVARHKALDQVRRESVRPAKEAAAMADAVDPAEPDAPDDQLRLVFMCCHPALSLAAQTALTLRAVCGLSTGAIAAAFLVPEPTMAQRLVRARRKIRQAGIAMRMPSADELPERVAAVLRVIYLVFTEGHMASSGPDLVQGALCEDAIRLARELSSLLPEEPEVTGLLALLLLTDARRAARTGPAGKLIQLADQDRSRWDDAKISAGRSLLEAALASGRPGAYQLHAAIAACHCDAASAEATDWRQIVALYNELLRYEPTPVVAANRAAAVAMADGPEAGLALLVELADDPAVAGWPPLHIARAELLRQLGQHAAALASYQAALDIGVAAAQQTFITSRMRELS